MLYDGNDNLLALYNGYVDHFDPCGEEWDGLRYHLITVGYRPCFFAPTCRILLSVEHTDCPLNSRVCSDCISVVRYEDASASWNGSVWDGWTLQNLHDEFVT